MHFTGLLDFLQETSSLKAVSFEMGKINGYEFSLFF